MKVRVSIRKMRENNIYQDSSTSNMASRGGETDSRDSSTQYPSDAVQATPLEVKVYGNNFERALKAFRALVQKERVLSSYKEKQTYEKRSDRRRRKWNEAMRKMMEDNRVVDNQKPSKKKKEE